MLQTSHVPTRDMQKLSERLDLSLTETGIHTLPRGSHPPSLSTALTAFATFLTLT